MNLLLESDLEPLLEERPGPCLSFYLPIFGPGTQPQQAPIRLKNLLGQAEADLRASELTHVAIEALLGPLEDLVPDLAFWNTREAGAALFRAPGFTSIFHLPSSFRERYTVGDHFFLKPLLPLVANDETFHVLALSQNEVRLLAATCRSVRRIGEEDLPSSLVDALGEQKTSQDLQYHTAASGRQTAIYHGHGVGAGDVKDELRRYAIQIEGVLRKLLAGSRAPLVLAGAEPLPSLFREVSAYSHLAESVIYGKPELLSDEELRDRAWQLLQPEIQGVRRRTAERFGELAGTGRASSDVKEILPAAQNGRVEALFLACDADVWGQLDPTMGEVKVHSVPQEGDEDLLDTAALLSLRHGGTVYGVRQNEVPGGAALAAVFRY